VARHKRSYTGQALAHYFSNPRAALEKPAEVAQ
jgi:hypothetical protein